jgi:hypothetical protein
MKRLVFSLLILISLPVSAQQLFTNSKSFDIFHNYTRWGIQLDALAYFPADIDDPGRFSFQSQLSFGYKFGLVYNLSFNDNFGFRIGALTGQTPAINTYFILKDSDTGSGSDYFHKKGARYSSLFSNFSFPLLFEYRNFTIDRYILNFDAGIQLERTGAAIITEVYDNHYLTTVMNEGSWDFDLVLKLGWYYQFKRLMMQTNLVYKHRFVNQYDGNYVFTNLTSDPPAVGGNYTQKGDYIGLSFDFFFHKRAREVDMGCRTNTQSQQVLKRQKAAQKAKERVKKRQEKIKRKKAKKMRKKAKKKWIFW